MPSRLFLLAVVVSFRALIASSFAPLPPATSRYHAVRKRAVAIVRISSSRLFSSPDDDDDDDDVARQLAKAKELLSRAKTKLNGDGNKAEVVAAVEGGGSSSAEGENEVVKGNGGEGGDGGTSLPFFANFDRESKREAVTKSKDESTGLITVDGDKLAAMSGREEWEVRPLSNVFEEEISEERAETYRLANAQLADRDVAASVFNLRKALKTEDYETIFDKRNRFIGEE